jgi:hypothetical protein
MGILLGASLANSPRSCQIEGSAFEPEARRARAKERAHGETVVATEGVEGAGVGLQGSLNDEESSQADTSPQDVEALGSDVVVDDLWK